ncbi:hypothetical protein [Pelomonas sp. KK5]|uniref:hypothetical protein n=1 Tax=Pelomonas sp. KK5 TaxID=1855730 RepID=UPI00097C07EC|nr:hypothetical protein [Pelomonas sp. KK5]
MKGRLLMAALLACATLQAAAAGCLLVYGQGRNVGAPAQNEAWDRINARFNGAVTARLRSAGFEAEPLLLKTGVLEPAQAVELLVERARERGCARIVDTAVFANEEGALVVRLRVHPLLLAEAGPILRPTPPRIGAPLYTGQSESAFTAAALERLNFDSLAGSLLEGWLATGKPDQ